jgi:hypothetical protein
VLQKEWQSDLGPPKLLSGNTEHLSPTGDSFTKERLQENDFPSHLALSSRLEDSASPGLPNLRK